MTNEEFLESITLEGEEWRDVVGFEGLYAVSNLGRVASLNRTRKFANGQVRFYKAKLLSPMMRKPYLSVSLCNESGVKQISIHRIVAAAFIPNPNNFPCVDHIDTNMLNNNSLNLRWCTQAENNRNPITQKRRNKAVAGRNIICNYKSVECIKNGRVVKTYPAIKFVIEDGFDPKKVSKVAQGKGNTHKGYSWRYVTEETSNQ